VTRICVVGGQVLDPVAAPVLAAVLGAVLDRYDELAAADPSVVAPCAAGVLSGAAAVVDRGLDEASGCCGQLWVRLVNLYPTAQFPAQDATSVGDRDLSWAVVVEVGVVRPAPVVREAGTELLLPTMEEETAAADRAVLDAAIVRDALLYTYADALDVGMVLGAFVPFGPDGGVVGGATTATVHVP
jgi:hypothetical protein